MMIPLILTAWAFLTALAWLFVHAASRGDPDEGFGGHVSPDDALTNEKPLSHEASNAV